MSLNLLAWLTFGLLSWIVSYRAGSFKGKLRCNKLFFWIIWTPFLFIIGPFILVVLAIPANKLIDWRHRFLAKCMNT